MELLPTRVKDYTISWLDDLCTAGRTLWTRLRPNVSDSSARSGGSLRSTPILLLPRRTASLWTRLAPTSGEDGNVSSRAQRVTDYLAQHGASFFDEIADGAHLLRTELEDALAELVIRGRVHCDSYAGLRALLVPASKRSPSSSRHRRRVALFGIQDAGRWALIRPPVASASVAGDDKNPEAIEHIARTLLRRYGVVCWRLLEREAAWLPPWRELVRVYQRLEARGEIRGGRFIAGLSGEQFALPEAIATLRQVRRLLRVDNLVNMDTRSVLACLPAIGETVPGFDLPDALVAAHRALQRAVGAVRIHGHQTPPRAISEPGRR